MDNSVRYGADLLPHVQASDRADRYSLNLWRWLRKHRKHPLFVAISTRERGPYDPKRTQPGDIYIGLGDLDQGWLHGARLSEILCSGTKASEWAFPPAYKFELIPYWWQGYIAGGKCFIDPEHLLYFDKERWDEAPDGKERACIWCCNHQQYLHTTMIPRTAWSNTAPEGAQEEETPCA